ncbi:ABC transporter ATP-binding protein [Dorea sp. 5-2]|nr:ABC transporter ATP-binding protein [Dorea sp. 5-2]
MSTLLEAKEVTKIYGKAGRPSLNKVSFRIDEGEFIGIMGASGSGKTTLLNVLSTIDTPTSGEIWINGVNLKNLNHTSAADFRKDNLGFIFQEYFLLDSLTIRENISVPLTLQKLSPEKIENMVRSLAERFGIASQLGKYPHELSGGQRQRASAARAIVKRPSILFADEPTGALDSSSATELLNTLYEANQELHTTILMVTHDAYAASFASRILIFKDGCIIKELAKHASNRRDFYEAIAAEVARLDTER